MTDKKEQKGYTLEGSLSVVVMGASGDLAKKKTFPALYALYAQGLLPSDVVIGGFARSTISPSDFTSSISKGLTKEYSEEKKTAFLERLFYFSGQYNKVEDFKSLAKELSKREAEVGGGKTANRIFYFAIPPSVFVDVGKGVKHGSLSTTGWNRVVIEKPFGHDSESSAALGHEVSKLFSEEEVYRIDHYLGKEMVQNIPVLRFSNGLFEPLWNRNHISAVLITFKEDFGTEGRGGYFDEFGMIRDVLQNHLMQILTLVAMEPPASLSAGDVGLEKVKVLRSIPPIELSDVVLGQYGPDAAKKHPGYLEDKTVPDGSVCPTFALAVLHVNNSRWRGVPFILKAGKALNAKKCDVRICFRQPPSGLFPDVPANELVLRVQPSEAIYWKLAVKKPGLKGGIEHLELDLTYGKRLGKAAKIPEAYERLIYDVVRGDHNLFVRDDELIHSWKIFTPLLHKIEKEKIKPEVYEYGSRGPASSDELIKKYGYVRNPHYSWDDEGSKKPTTG